MSGLRTNSSSLFQDKIDDRRRTTDIGILHVVGFGALSVLVAKKQFCLPECGQAGKNARTREHAEHVNMLNIVNT